ncbi:MAG: hypothetical protein GC164_04330 [Phycisphaera sp.]|nr:hypothetical protein [Phycisphaera sp.]
MKDASFIPGRLLIDLLADPRKVAGVSLRDWDRLVPLARWVRLLGRLRAGAIDTGVYPDLDGHVRNILDSSWTVAQDQNALMAWEVSRVRDALRGMDVPIVLLKGAAYMLSGLPPARGRFASDLDIMVPIDRITEVEARMTEKGYSTFVHDPYDDHYYRRWMHELPPMVHRRRTTVIDVHHTILPRTTRINLDPRKLFERAVDIPGQGVKRLCDEDLILHSAAHLFCEGEFDLAIRDLCDMNDLFAHFADQKGFGGALLARAQELDLLGPLFYAQRYTHHFFATRHDTPAPQPSAWCVKLMDSLVHRAAIPARPNESTSARRLAAWGLFMRGHFIKMPLPLLAMHLTVKSWLRFTHFVQRLFEKKPQDA